MGRIPKKLVDKDLDRLLKTVGANIKFLRLNKDFTQAELARKSRISVTTLNEIETKRFRDIRLSTLMTLATTLQVPVVKLISESDVKIDSSDQKRLLSASEDIQRIINRLKTDHK